jgi:hypothetical protein
MKALSFTQPWASLVIDGRKKIETRSWPTNFRGEIAIHAAKSIDADACVNFSYNPDTIVRGAIIGIATLTECFRFTAANIKEFSDAELSYGDFTPGRYGFRLERVRTCLPIPCRGSLGLWTTEYSHFKLP